MRRLASFALVILAAGCGGATAQQSPPIVQPGAPGQPGRVLSANEAERMPRPGVTAADVKFMRGMIGHHAQAIEMTALLRTRTRSDSMRRLAERIDVSQSDEIRMMEQWLRDHGQPLPDAHAHHAAGATLMPGMLTQDEMAQLAAAAGPEFDRLFLRFMITHHQGALAMVKELRSSPGAAQESEINRFASDVDADQRMEIDRMAAMLVTLKEK